MIVRRSVLMAAAWLVAGANAANAQAAPFDTAKVDQVFAKFLGNDSPGCALGVYRDGKVVYAQGYGMADLERRVPITPTTLFDLGSTSKQFTSAAIALLVAEGKVRYEDEIRTYVPEVPDYGTPITLDHLVRHTSGLRDYTGLLVFAGRRIDDASDDADALDVIGRQRALNFPPGSEWDYSNTGFFLLSIVVERVTGKTLAAFAKERIFGPLGMDRTHFRNDHNAMLRGRALGYSPGDEGGLVNDVPNWDQLGDGAVWSSVEELARWDANFYDPKVGGRALLDRLLDPGRLNDGSLHGYGRGLFLDRYRGLERVHHGGAWGGYRAMLMRFPTERTSIGITCNVATANTQALAEGVADVVLANALSAAPAPVAAAPSAAPIANVDPSSFVGLYYAEVEDQVVVLERSGADLVARLQGAPRGFPLSPVASDSFAARGIPVAIQFDRDGGTIRGLRLSVGGSARGSFRRVQPATPTADDLAGLAGRYYSPELDAVYRIEAGDGHLSLVSRGIGTLKLEPAMRDAFAGRGLVRFTRDRKGRITGFRLSASRMRGLVFERMADGR